MQNQENGKRPHIVLTNTSTARAFKPKARGGPGGNAPPARDREQHGKSLKADLSALQLAALHAGQLQATHQLRSGVGSMVEFAGFPNVELAFDKLESKNKHIELMSLRSEADTTYANVFVPEGGLDHFETYLADYVGYKRRGKNPHDHRTLIDAIAAIRPCSLHALWTDDASQLPQDPDFSFWWEVWLPAPNDWEAVLGDFRKLANLAGCEVADHHAKFPERTVVWMRGTRNQVQNSPLLLNCVAELRRAKDTAEFFDGLPPAEQLGWIDNALPRIHAPHGAKIPRVCLLDSGVNRAHPMLSPFIASADLHTNYPPDVDDQANHGTGLAGLALYGDMVELLAGNAPIDVRHRLESVKIIRHAGQEGGGEHSHAALFEEAVGRPEVTEPNAPRLFATAVTASDYRDRGRPSSWSAMVDSLASDASSEPDEKFPRLFILSAGNTVDQDALRTYHDSLSTSLIHDPGQAWNALTVGAFTEKIDTESNEYQPVACNGGLSPFTTTSAAWDKAWPYKPDIVMEGGNASKDGTGFAAAQASLSLLTVNNNPQERLLTTTNATSAASALCARLAAQIMAAYPLLWPETVRALVVHSAEWTDAMQKTHLPVPKKRIKRDWISLIRHCGWGVPNLARALWSAGNSLTLLVEDEVLPYKKMQGKRNGEIGDPVTRDMNLHELPWPRKELLALGAEKVRLRITLSYFIEPNPSTRGSSSKFHYPSHRLRFSVQRPGEATTAFAARISAEAEQAEASDSKDSNWLVGDKQRHNGSLHQDEWEGTAADLADRGFIAVYPANGWWRTRPTLVKYNQAARYSLVVSIRTNQTEVDLYALIEQQIATSIEVGE